jgi:catechol 2,3-dioxygenase-like lactoylglutathione lyase family enzyme
MGNSASTDGSPTGEVVIGGIQQIGIGVAEVEEAWAWYRRVFGMDVPVFREAADAPGMCAYTGGQVHGRDAVLAVNLAGGSGFEVWQFTTRVAEAPSKPIEIGDRGIIAARIKSPDVNLAFLRMTAERRAVVDEPRRDPGGNDGFFVRDPAANLFHVVRSEDWFGQPRGVTGGPVGALIGVGSIDAALPLYRDLLAFDRVVYDESGVFEDFASLPGGTRRVRRVLLTHDRPRSAPFGRIFGIGSIELVQADEPGPHIYEGRYWGDLGFIHLCFDVRGMDGLAKRAAEAGFPFTVDTGTTFDMGDAGGRFAYLEDPDGTLIEFVETHKIPILKRFGIALDLTKRPADKPLPDRIIRLLGLGRKRD